MNRISNFIRKFGPDKGFTSVIGANTFSSIIGSIFWIYLATLLSTEDYGLLNYYLSIAFLLSTVSLFGLRTVVITYLPKALEKVQLQANFLILISNFIILIFLFIFFQHLPTILLLLGISFFEMACAEDLGRLKYKRYYLRRISARLLNLVLSLSLFFIMGIDGIILGYAISTLVFSYNFYKSLKLNDFSFSELRTRFSFIKHNYVLALSRKFSSHIDKILIAPLFGFALLGEYTLGFQVLVLLSVLPVSSFEFLLPRASAGLKDSNIPKLSLIAAILLSIISFILIPIVLPVIFPNFVESVLGAQIMIFGVIPMTVNAILSSKFLAKEKSKPVFFGGIVRISSLVVLIIILGSSMGIMGLALAVVISLLLNSLTLFFFYRFKLEA